MGVGGNGVVARPCSGAVPFIMLPSDGVTRHSEGRVVCILGRWASPPPGLYWG